MQYAKIQLSRRTRQRLYFATGILSLFIWLFMATAEICTPLHAWLHGGTIPKDDDDCAIVAIAHGKVETVTCEPPAVVPVNWIEISACENFSIFSSTKILSVNDRAPPFASAVS